MPWLNGTSAQDFETYARQVYAWAYRLLGRHHDALDVVQEVFIRWDRQCNASTPDKPMGWLRRVTVNRAIDLRRRREANPTQSEATIAQTPVPRIASDDLGLLRSDIAKALAELTHMQRGVLIAKVYDDRTFAEIADEMNLSIPTVKTHYLRAIRTMRDKLGPKWGEENIP